MATITHTKVSAVSDGGDATKVRPSDWNANHTIVGDTTTSGALVFLGEQVASSSATLDFTNFISSSYDEYEFHFVGLRPATNNVDLYMRLSTSGSFDSGSNYVNASYLEATTGSVELHVTVSAFVARNNGELQNTSGVTTAGRLTLYGPQSANKKWVNGNILWIGSTGGVINTILGGYWNNTATVDGVRFLYSSGNIAEGTIRVYGVAKAASVVAGSGSASTGLNSGATLLDNGTYVLTTTTSQAVKTYSFGDQPRGKYLLTVRYGLQSMGPGLASLDASSAGGAYSTLDSAATHSNISGGWRMFSAAYDHSGGVLSARLYHTAESGNSVTYGLSADARFSPAFTATSVGGSGVGSGVGANVYNSATQSITNATWTAQTFDTEAFDTDGLHSTATNTGRMTIPTGLGGKYLVTGHCQFNNTSGSNYTRFTKNGAGITGSRVSSGVNASGTTDVVNSLVADLAAGDYIEFEAQQNSGSSSTTGTATGDASNSFSIMRIDALPPAQGAMVLLQQQTASASAQLDFTTCISSTYDEYVIEFLNVLPATNSVALWMRMSTDAGSTYDTGANYGWNGFVMRAAATATAGAESGATAIQVGYSADMVNTAAYGGLTGTLRLYAPGATATYKRVLGQVVNRDVSAFNVQSAAQGIYISTTAVNAFRFLMSSGNITSGTIRVYGIAK